MAPILGIMASQISGHLWAPSGAYDSIATTTVGAGGASSITFSSIPSTYTHLQVRWISRSAGSNVNVNFNVNGDTTSTANWHLLYGDGSSAGAYTISTAYMWPGYSAISTTGSNIFGTGVTDFLDYANTNKNKTVRSLTGLDMNGSGYVALGSSQWINTAAITSITFKMADAANFSQYTSFALYGIKGGN